MKTIITLLGLLSFTSMYAQLEITNLDKVELDENIIMQQIPLEVFNNSNDTIAFDWEIEYLNNSNSFLEISVSDINNDYTPQVLTTCGMVNTTNVLLAQDDYTMGLHFRINDIPSGFDKSVILAYYNLYQSGQCSIDTLISLPIFFDLSTSSLDVKREEEFFLSPNPVKNFLNISNAEKHFGEFVEIYASDGRLILKETFTDSSVDVSSLVGGVYFVRLKGIRQAFTVIN